jgi:nucleoside-diphosphate-sugar epimerase
VSTFGVYDRPKISGTVIRESDPIGGHNLYTVTKLCSEHLVRSYTEQYKLDTIIIRPSGVFGRGLYVGGSTVGKVMRDLALNVIKGEPFTIDAKTYAPNEYVYGKDVGLALFLACQAQNPKQRIYNAGSGVVTGPEALAQTIAELVPALKVKVVGSSGAAVEKNAALDLSTSKAELGYTPKYPLREALRDYVEELWEEQRS